MVDLIGAEKRAAAAAAAGRRAVHEGHRGRYGP
jgi:hypothetical protein